MQAENWWETGIEAPVEGKPCVCVPVKWDLHLRIHERKTSPSMDNAGIIHIQCGWVEEEGNKSMHSPKERGNIKYQPH